MSATSTERLPDSKWRWSGALLLAAIGTVHFVVMNFHPEEYIDSNYWLGALMFSGGVATYVAAVLLIRSDRASVAWGWIVGAGTAALMVTGLFLSRTVGLFGFHQDHLTLEGALALFLEIGLIGMALLWSLRQAIGRR